MGGFFKSEGGKNNKAAKNIATNIGKNPEKSLETGAVFGSAAASINPEAALSKVP